MALHLIAEFDKFNIESFIEHIQAAVKRFANDQHKLLLYVCDQHYCTETDKKDKKHRKTRRYVNIPSRNLDSYTEKHKICPR